MSLIPAHSHKAKEADEIIQRYITYTAGAGFIPIPLLDTVAIAGVQFVMIKQLAQLYEVDFQEYRTKSVIGALLGSVGTNISAFKFFPGGMTIGIVKTSIIGAVYTYALGKVFSQHFDQGGTLSDFDPLTSKVYFKEELEKGKTQIRNIKNKVPFLKDTSQQIILNQLLKEKQQQNADLLKMQTDLKQMIAQKNKNSQIL